MTSRLAESQECMRAVQPELRTVLGSNPDMMGGGRKGERRERERAASEREREREREREVNTQDK